MKVAVAYNAIGRDAAQYVRKVIGELGHLLSKFGVDFKKFSNLIF